MANLSKRRVTEKPFVQSLAKMIRIDALKSSRTALNTLDHKDDASFAAAVQIAIVGGGFSANELGRALGYDTGTIIKWYQGVMAPPRAVARQEVVEVIKVLIDRQREEWEGVKTSSEGIQKIAQRNRGAQPVLRWEATEHEIA